MLVEQARAHRIRHCPWRRARWAAGLVLLLAACASQTRQQPMGTPTCYPLPQATGEKYIEPTVEAGPARQVMPGQVITVAFSGNYLIVNNAIVCGDTVAGYKHSDELPSFDWQRPVRVLLDGQALKEVQCGYDCQLAVTIPLDSVPGAHVLRLATNREDLRFDLEVVAR
jgi:hypothetical protein